MDQQKIENFFSNSCTAEEAKQVLRWFATEEGQEYLANRFDEDVELLQNKHIKPMLSELNSAKMWKNIETGMSLKKRYSRKKIASYWYVAVVVLVACTVSVLFFYWQDFPSRQKSKNKEPIHFITGTNQQKVFTLSDGTKIRLNSNSQLWISGNYGRGNRDVTLKGEAYFEVKHDADHPFTVHVHGALIKDIGTAFSVQAIPEENNVQVAVKQGKVSVSPKNEGESHTVQLTGGQFGYLNLKTDSMTVDDFAVKNYLSWMTQRINFDNALLKKVSEQLGRIYDVSFDYASDSLKFIRLSADFERGTLKKALTVISLTLSLDYQVTNGHVFWKDKETERDISEIDFKWSNRT